MQTSATCGLSVRELRTSAGKLWPERVVPAATPFQAFSEAGMRYAFAADYVKGREVLDVACGTGIGSSFLRLAGARSVTGVDVSGACISLAQELYPNCAFMKGDACALPFSAGSFDVAVSFETIEHLSDAASFLDSCLRVLRPGGLLVISTPNREVSRFTPNPYHIKEFRLGELVELVRSRFSKVDAFGQSPVNMFTFIPVRSAVRFLETLGLKNALRTLIRPRTSELVEDLNFEVSKLEQKSRVFPYTQSLFQRPTYHVLICRK